MNNKFENSFYRSQIRIMCGEMGFCLIPDYQERLYDWYLRVSISHCDWLAK